MTTRLYKSIICKTLRLLKICVPCSGDTLNLKRRFKLLISFSKCKTKTKKTIRQSHSYDGVLLKSTQKIRRKKNCEWYDK